MFFRCGCKSDNIMVSLVGSNFQIRRSEECCLKVSQGAGLELVLH